MHRVIMMAATKRQAPRNYRTNNKRLILANICIAGRRKTGVKFEPELWECLNLVCQATGLSTDELFTYLKKKHSKESLTSVARSYLANILIHNFPASVNLNAIKLSEGRQAKRFDHVVRITDC